jgi:hypothetical protein
MIRIIGHRGGRNLWAENSLGGFRKTATLGVDAVELDLHLTQDGEIVVIHDPFLERTTNGSGAVSDHSLQALTSLRLKETIDETIPTLAQVLECNIGAGDRQAIFGQRARLDVTGEDLAVDQHPVAVEDHERAGRSLAQTRLCQTPHQSSRPPRSRRGVAATPVRLNVALADSVRPRHGLR